MKTVKPRNFWSKGFVFLCFVPMLVFTILHAVAGSWINATWQAVTLLILCANNYLLCLNDTLRRDLFEQLQINIALIEHLKEIIKDDEENNEREKEK